MKTTRRIFLKDSGLAVVSVGIAPALGPLFLRSAAYAQEPVRLSSKTGGKKTLVCIFQRGAVDGMSMVVPHGDPYYYQHRIVGPGGIGIANTGPDGVIDLDGKFGLHPSLAPLKPIYDAGHLAAVQACGSPNATRSHFDAQDYMESAAPGDKAISTGWLTRALQCCPEDRTKLRSLFQGVAMTGYVPRSFQGDPHALAIPDFRTFGLTANARPKRPRWNAPDAGMIGDDVAAAFREMYDSDSGDVLHGTGKDMFEAIRVVRQLNKVRYMPENGARYPGTAYGRALMQIAQLVKSNLGLEVGFAELGGWDTHVRQGGAQGQLSNRLREFSQGLSAFYTDLGDRMADVAVLTMSEFGRTARQNGNGGTDHGHATCFFAMGGEINGGKVLGEWPGLAPEQLNENRDLAVTTDFRDVFGELAQRHLGVARLAAVFPGYEESAAKFRGVVRA
ncbi:MAG TPA: DUF1501 domain-containing protein [Chthonomonadales bacterium]|nr:DUF1501 domain-containing protein [Chthonomonadales bacterium]